MPPKLRKRWIGVRSVSLREENARDRAGSERREEMEQRPPDPDPGPVQDEKMAVDHEEVVQGACVIYSTLNYH